MCDLFLVQATLTQSPVFLAQAILTEAKRMLSTVYAIHLTNATILHLSLKYYI